MPETHRRLILLVSKGKPCEKAIEHHLSALEFVWLLHSDDSKATAASVEKFASFLKSSLTVETRGISDVHNPVPFYDCVVSIYRNHPTRIDPADIISDFTGMTKHASVGMVLACMKHNLPLKYTPQENNGESLSPILIPLRHGKSRRESE